MTILLALAILLISPVATAASFDLFGPSVIHVGDTASYEVRIDLSPGERIYGVTGSFFVENGRTLASWEYGANDSKGRYGFMDTGYSVDAATYWADGHVQDSVPVWIEGELNTPIDRIDRTADQGPFTIVPFTLTALAPGQLQFVVAQGPYPPPAVQSGYITGGGLNYLYHDDQGQGVSVFIPPAADGTYGQITIVTEPSVSALSALSLVLVTLVLRAVDRSYRLRPT